MAGPFIITELTGEKRELRLQGRALPYRPFTLTGSMRHELTWYAGSPEGTIQIQGSAEDSTTINGWWKERFIRSLESLGPETLGTDISLGIAGQQGDAPAKLNGRAISGVVELTNLVNDMRKKGQEVKVTWQQHVRRGIISKFTQKWHTDLDVEWELDFVWISDSTEPLDDVPVKTRELEISSAPQEIANEIQDNFADDIAAFSADVQRQLGVLANATRDLQNNVIINFQNITSPVAVAQRAASTFNALKATSIELYETLEREAADVINAFSFLDFLDDYQDRRERTASARRIGGTSALREQQALDRVNPEVIRSFVAREGQDLRDVCTQFYGSPDSWKQLMQYNELSSSVLSAGQLVLVPRSPPDIEGNC